MTNASDKRWLAATASIGVCVSCGGYPAQVAHRNYGKGMGLKTRPWMTASLCQACHHEIDNGRDMSREQRRAEMDRAIVETHHRLVLAGKLGLR